MAADVFRRAGRGAIAGGAAGIMCLAVGLIRVILFLLTGGRVAGLTAADLRQMGFYVGGFTLAGCVVGAIWPVFRGRVGEYAAFALRGSIVGIAIVVGEAGSKSPKSSDWVIGIVIGSMLGCAFAYGWRKGPS